MTFSKLEVLPLKNKMTFKGILRVRVAVQWNDLKILFTLSSIFLRFSIYENFLKKVMADLEAS